MSYGFGGRLTEAFPSQVIVDVTEVCNLACIHCPHPEFKKSEHYGARYLDPELFRKAVDEVAVHGSQYIRVVAEGEPLIHPDIYEMLDYAVEKSRTFVTMTTNGTIMNERRMRKLLDSGLHMVDVSIDAYTKETYTKIRIGGDFEAVTSNVRRLINSGGPKVVVSFVEQEQNRHEVQDFVEFWTKAGARPIVRRLHSAAGALYFVKKKGRYPCLYPWERILLGPNGWLSFCPQEWFKRSVVADYRTTTIKETWEGQFYKDLRTAHLENQCYGVCKTCPDWEQTRWPGQGKSYADLVSDLAA